MASKEISKYCLQSLDLLSEPLFIIDPDFRCIFFNRALMAFLGYEADPEARCGSREFWPEIESVDFSLEQSCTEFRGKSGGSFPVKIAVKELDDSFRLVRVIAGAPESQSVQSFHAQRLEMLGILAAGIAHDFNNILAGILGHITYLKTILPPVGEHIQSLSAIEEGSMKAAMLTQEILNFSKLDSAEQAANVDLNSLVLQMHNLLRGAISPAYTVRCHVPEAEIVVLGIEGQIAQVIANLVINARDAVESGGEVVVELSSLDDRKKLAAVFQTEDLSAPHYAVLRVRDNGHGMSPEILKRIFEPYFSTKPRGTGLGLSTVRSIVRSLGGAIEAESRVDVGTVISVYLPVVDSRGDPRDGVEDNGTRMALEGGDEKVLIVDDEYPVRNVLALSLVHLGYQVETAGSGAEAFEKFSVAGEYDLVILDMLMPNLPGEEVFARLRKIDPEVKVILISGFSSEDLVQNVLKSGGMGFIQKPFTIEDLSKKVRECLDAPD